MAKVKVKGTKELAQRLNRNLRIEINKLFRDAALRERVGKIIAEDIKDNVDFGSPADSTLKWRERYDRINNTDPKYRRNKLNATFTGELLYDLAKNIKSDTTNLSFVVEHSKNKHKRYSGVNGQIGKRTPYQVISDHLVNDLGYNYFSLSDKGRERITKEIQDVFYRLLAKY